MSTETLMRRRAAALPEDPSSTVDGVQCDGAGELGLDGLSIEVESREQLVGSRLQALGSYDDDLTRHINLRSLQDSNGNHDRHGSLDAGIEERDQPIMWDGDGGHVGRREVDHEARAGGRIGCPPTHRRCGAGAAPGVPGHQRVTEYPGIARAFRSTQSVCSTTVCGT
ncbi:MAG: hypothetical protein ACRDIL_02945 [Candidatus Limnocylindrales bacterium]